MRRRERGPRGRGAAVSNGGITRGRGHEGHEDGLATKGTKTIWPQRTRRRFGHEDTQSVRGFVVDYASIPADVELVATEVIGAAIEVHRHLGAGFVEKIYQEALCLELDARKVPFERERAVVVVYKGFSIPGQRIDLIVATRVVVELKAAARIDIASEARIISYLRTTGLRLGLLLNFNNRTMKEGIKRVAL
jgi:GxxExxY protein